MKRSILSLLLSAAAFAQEPAERSAEMAAKPQYGQMGSYEWSGSISGSYSVANTYNTSPAGETKLTQISIAPLLNIFVRNRFYMGGGPNFLYSYSQINIPTAAAISIEQAFLGPQMQMGILWPMGEKVFLNTRAIALAQVAFVSEYKGIKGTDPRVGSLGGEVILQRLYDKVLLNMGVQFLYSQYLTGTGTGLLQSQYTTRITFGFSFWVS